MVDGVHKYKQGCLFICCILIFVCDCRYSDIARKFFLALPCGFLELVLGHYFCVHAMMNFGAELTRFADRQFYTVRGMQFLLAFVPKCIS